MRPLGALLIILGLVALAASRLVTVATLDVVLVLVGVIVLLAGVALVVFGRSDRERRDEQRVQDGVGERDAAAASPRPSSAAAGNADRSLSSPVPLGPASEAGATPGTGTSAPGPVVRTADLPAPSTASATVAPPMPAAPVLDDGPPDTVDRVVEERRSAAGPQHRALEDTSDRPG